MTGLLHEKSFSRKAFVKGGGALIVGFSVAGAGFAGKAEAATSSPFASNGPRGSLLFDIDSYLVIHADNTASIMGGKVELGQGTTTGLLMIAGEELNMGMSQLTYVHSDTNVTPDTGGTYASLGIRNAGPPVRMASALAMQALVGMASTNLGVPVASLTAAGGVISGGGKSVTYGDLIGGQLFNVEMTDTAATGVPPQKPVSSYTLVGTMVQRIDIPAKVTGTYTYVHNVRVPAMLHGRIVRPRGQGAWTATTTAVPVSVDDSSVSHIPNVQVVRVANLLGVVAPLEYDAIQAAGILKVTWAAPPTLPGDGDLWAEMRAQDSAGLAPNIDNVFTGNVNSALASAAETVSKTYSFPYNAHSVIGPSCSVADVTPAGAVIYSNTQDVYETRRKVALVTGLPTNVVRVRYYEGASAFGTGAPYDDCVESAAVMSQVVGKPVRLQWMRWDEMGWDNFGPALLMDISGGIDPNGKLVGYDYSVFAIPYYQKRLNETTQQLLGMPLGADSPTTASNLSTQYNIPNVRVTTKELPLLGNYFKTSFFRAPQIPQTAFGSEQLIDELAYAAKMDPVAFRQQNVTTATVSTTDPTAPWTGTYTDRWLGVMNAATQAANWQPRVAASNVSTDTIVTGRGFAVTSGVGDGGRTSLAQLAATGVGLTVPSGYTGDPVFSAAVAHIELNKKTGQISVKHVYVAQDSGLPINPGLMENQMSGQIIMATSRVLHEEVRFNTTRVTSLDWVTYPILRFEEHPSVTTIVVPRTDKQAGPSSEDVLAPTAAAIANAFFDATGVRMRTAPMTPARVRETLAAGGSGTPGTA